jgi:hypothetical protein
MTNGGGGFESSSRSDVTCMALMVEGGGKQAPVLFYLSHAQPVGT